MNQHLRATILRGLGLAICFLLASGGQSGLRAQAAHTPTAKIEVKDGKVIKVEEQTVARTDRAMDRVGQVIRPRKFDSQNRGSDQPTISPRRDSQPGQETDSPESELGQAPSRQKNGRVSELTIDNEPSPVNASANESRTQTVLASVDLVISSVSVLDATGPSISYRFVIGNNGPDAVTPTFLNHVYLSANSQITTSDHFLRSYSCSYDIPAGGSQASADLEITVSEVPDGLYYVGVIVDGSNVVLETNETNNTNYDATPKVTITNPGTRDLDVVSVEVLDGAGPTIGYRFTLTNNGTASVPSGFETDVYLSSNTTISNTDHLIQTRTATAALAAGANYTSPNVYLPISGVPDGAYYLGVITDGSGVVSETNEANNVGYDISPQVSIGTSGTYDLDVVSVEVLDATGPEIQFRYTIGNNGTGMVSSGFHNDIYLSTNTSISAIDFKIDTRVSGSDVAAGGSYTTGTLSRTVSGVPDGSYYLGVITDATDLVTETNESNNTGHDASPLVSLSSPDTYDLDVSAVEVLDATGPSITFRYTLVNHGTGAITVTFSNDYYLSSNTTITKTDHLIGTRSTVSDIAAGGTHTSADLDFSIGGVPDGSYYLGVITDADSIITETIESNNAGYDGSPLVTINASTVFDLSVSSVEVIDATGPDITFKYTISNSGTGEVAAGFENHIYLSTNPTISPSDHLIDTWVSGQAVPAGGSYTTRELASTVVGVPNGTYYLGVITDGGADIEEINEANNTGFDTSPQVTISSSLVYDLYVSSVEVLDGSCPDIEYRYVIGNNGSDVVPMGFVNRIYLSPDVTISTSDHLIDTRMASNNVPAAGTYTSVNLSCTVSGVPDGLYYLGVITDGAGTVAETNEGNNVGLDNAHQLTVGATAVEETPGALPTAYQLRRNYPNPFNPSTTIEFQLPWESEVQFVVYNTLGQEVDKLMSGRMPAGTFRTTWRPLSAAGVYYGRFIARPVNARVAAQGSYTETLRMILVK